MGNQGGDFLVYVKLKRQMSDSMKTALFIILSGGFQDAYTYICRGEVFANAQTGNIVLMSTHFFSREWGEALRYLIPILSFLLGTCVAELIHRKFKSYEKIHWRQIVLIIEMILLTCVGFMPHSLDAAANALVSFVCALQVQSFHKVRGHAYASTMCIGNMRVGTESLIAYFHTRDKAEISKSAVYFSVILLFAVGAGVGGVITMKIGTSAIFISTFLLLISFIMMFIHDKEL